MSSLDWQDKGACRQVINPETGIELTRTERTALFFPEKDKFIQPLARQVCASCPVLSECREWSIVNQQFGFSGGMGEGERAVMRSSRGIWLQNGEAQFKVPQWKVTAIPCPSAKGYKMHLKRGQKVAPIENGGCGCLEEHREMTRAAKQRLRDKAKTGI